MQFKSITETIYNVDNSGKVQVMSTNYSIIQLFVNIQKHVIVIVLSENAWYKNKYKTL